MENIDPRHLLVKIAKILKKIKIPYLITGGIAVLIWGRPRFTADIDIVVELSEKNIEKLAGLLKKTSELSYIDESMMREALEKEGEFNFIHGDSGIKIDFWILKRNELFDVSRMKRRVPKKILGEKVYFSSPEDLILIKLKWYKDSLSSRNLEDAESIYKISGDKLDKTYLKKWAKKLNILDILNKLAKRK